MPPQVLDYVRLRKRRSRLGVCILRGRHLCRPESRLRLWIDSTDSDLAEMSLLQLGAWAWYLSKDHYARPVTGDQWSLYAFAWRWVASDYWLSIFGVLTTIGICMAALRPAGKRLVHYCGYMITVVAAPIFYWLAVIWANAYLVSQLAGVWGSILNWQPKDEIPALILFLLQPVFWMLLARAIFPGHRFVGRRN